MTSHCLLVAEEEKKKKWKELRLARSYPKRVMQRLVLNELSKEILSGNIQKESVVGITLGEDGNLQFLNLDSVPL